MSSRDPFYSDPNTPQTGFEKQGLGWASPPHPVSADAFKQALSNLRPQKTKKAKNWNFRPREAREFLGSWDKNSNTVKTQKFHTSGVCLREDKKSRTKNGQYFEFSEFTSFRMFVACMTGSVWATQGLGPFSEKRLIRLNF